ncbi:hypothetical protein [Nonomuraea aridisoli]|uniref:hypothetical protein n=1 Tax=Nonomuraea aridisoli TaxID=2070368 RepID=UPI0015E8EAE7|nr:hypothetical protein [Nonomuraea aridisoli]
MDRATVTDSHETRVTIAPAGTDNPATTAETRPVQPTLYRAITMALTGASYSGGWAPTT